MSAEAIRFDDVSFSFGDVPVLVGVGFEVAPGELVHLVGRSGAGKTTLLCLAHGQLRPGTGRVVVDGVPILRGGDRRLWRRVHMVFQDSRLLPRLTALENVTYALRVIDLGLSAGEAGRRAREALRDAGLEERLRAFPRRLSAGQRQRVAVARAVACAPAVVLADEPAASLDAASSGVVQSLFRRLTRRGTAVLLTTCDAGAGELGRPGAGRVLRLEDGALAEEPAGGTRRWAAV